MRKVYRTYEQQKRKVLMCVDNFGAHGPISNMQAIILELSPPNTTSVSQPMDQGVIKNLKLHYRSPLLNCVLLCADRDKSYAVDGLTAVSILSDSWRAATQDTIRNCFRHAGFVVGSEYEGSHTVPNPTTEMPPAAASDIFDDLRASGVNVGAATF
ncbi:hypothetical protein HPB48_001391 [Haemaphysalis longicornis]|uniref:DDE-1 domain-containing protein n=1 Tax=Haemaphysalis longicornis TaxID=44386 RepID=A0A9J6GZT2_HAELO|nr:hypothetical protein HPB48_001391 [Haemaphysalis longicornis]